MIEHFAAAVQAPAGIITAIIVTVAFCRKDSTEEQVKTAAMIGIACGFAVYVYIYFVILAVGCVALLVAARFVGPLLVKTAAGAVIDTRREYDNARDQWHGRTPAKPSHQLPHHRNLTKDLRKAAESGDIPLLLELLDYAEGRRNGDLNGNPNRESDDE